MAGVSALAIQLLCLRRSGKSALLRNTVSHHKSCSVFDPVEEVTERKIMSKFFGNNPHGILVEMRSLISSRVKQSWCHRGHYRRSFQSTAIRLFNSFTLCRVMISVISRDYTSVDFSTVVDYYPKVYPGLCQCGLRWSQSLRVAFGALLVNLA